MIQVVKKNKYEEINQLKEKQKYIKSKKKINHTINDYNIT